MMIIVPDGRTDDDRAEVIAPIAALRSVGHLLRARVEVDAIEDTFGMPDTVYTEPGSGWVDPSEIPPEPMIYPPPGKMITIGPRTVSGNRHLSSRED